MREPTIYEVLRDKLKREPTHAELCADVRRILGFPVQCMRCRGTVKVPGISAEDAARMPLLCEPCWHKDNEARSRENPEACDVGAPIKL